METTLGEIKVIQDENAKTLSYFCSEETVVINEKIINQLVEESKRRNNCDVRICLHNSPSEKLHNMIILQHKERYYRPHKHLDKYETYHLIKGKMAFITFDETGVVTTLRMLNADEKNIIRVGPNKWHVSVPLTERIIFHESRTGPFVQGDSVFPIWAPDGSDFSKAKEYNDFLLKTITGTIATSQERDS